MNVEITKDNIQMKEAAIFAASFPYNFFVYGKSVKGVRHERQN